MSIHRYFKKKIRGKNNKFLQIAKVKKITKEGFYLSFRSNLYYFSFLDHPYFKYATSFEIRDVEVSSWGDLHWDRIDVSMYFDSLENPHEYLWRAPADLYPWIRPRVEKAGDDYEKFKKEDWYYWSGKKSLLVQNLEKDK